MNDKIKEKLLKEVVEILLDYNFNSTKTETTEQYAYKLIKKVEKETKKEERDRFEKITEEVFEECEKNLIGNKINYSILVQILNKKVEVLK